MLINCVKSAFAFPKAEEVEEVDLYLLASCAKTLILLLSTSVSPGEAFGMTFLRFGAYLSFLAGAVGTGLKLEFFTADIVESEEEEEEGEIQDLIVDRERGGAQALPTADIDQPAATSSRTRAFNSLPDNAPRRRYSLSGNCALSIALLYHT